MHETIRTIADNGISLTIAVGVLALLWFAGRRAIAPGGWVDQIVGTHKDFVQSVEAMGQKQYDLLASHARDGKTACQDVANLRRAALRACDLLEIYCRTTGIDERSIELIGEIRQELLRNEP